jgi:hypothetical protein
VNPKAPGDGGSKGTTSRPWCTVHAPHSIVATSASSSVDDDDDDDASPRTTSPSPTHRSRVCAPDGRVTNPGYRGNATSENSGPGRRSEDARATADGSDAAVVPTRSVVVVVVVASRTSRRRTLGRRGGRRRRASFAAAVDAAAVDAHRATSDIARVRLRRRIIASDFSSVTTKFLSFERRPRS